MRLAAKGWAQAWKAAEAFDENSSRKPRRGGAHPACGRWYTRKARTRKQKLAGKRKKKEGGTQKTRCQGIKEIGSVSSFLLTIALTSSSQRDLNRLPPSIRN